MAIASVPNFNCASIIARLTAVWRYCSKVLFHCFQHPVEGESLAARLLNACITLPPFRASYSNLPRCAVSINLHRHARPCPPKRHPSTEVGSRPADLPSAFPAPGSSPTLHPPGGGVGVWPLCREHARAIVTSSRFLGSPMQGSASVLDMGLQLWRAWLLAFRNYDTLRKYCRTAVLYFAVLYCAFVTQLVIREYRVI